MFTNLTYELGGVPVNTQTWTIDYESTSTAGGLLDVGFIGVFLNFFPSDGLQLYSGPETSPTILTGSFPYSSAAGSDISVFFGPHPSIAGTLTVANLTPEPSTLSLFSAMGAGLILRQLRTKRTA